MKPMLVTGAAGFIGAKVAEQLLQQGYPVVGIDNLNSYYDVGLKLSRLTHLHSYPSFRFQRLDLEDAAATSRLVRHWDFEAIFHLAARAGVRASLENPWLYLGANIDGTLSILEAMRRHGCRKLVFASTSSLYAGAQPPFREDHPVDKPLSPYAAAKRAAELLCYTYHHHYDIDISIVRYFTVFGPTGRPDMAPWRFIEAIRTGLPVTIHGDGKQSRDFTYVDDIAAGTIAASKKVGYEIFNLGGGRTPMDLLTFVHNIEDLLDKRADLHFSEANPADMQETRADISKARHLLGWEPQVETLEGLRRTVESHTAAQFAHS